MPLAPRASNKKRKPARLACWRVFSQADIEGDGSAPCRPRHRVAISSHVAGAISLVSRCADLLASAVDDFHISEARAVGALDVEMYRGAMLRAPS